MSGSDETEQTIKVPLEEWVKQIAEHAAKKAAQCVLADHQEHVDRLYRRVRAIEIILALIIGSGVLGGGGVLLSKLLTH